MASLAEYASMMAIANGIFFAALRTHNSLLFIYVNSSI